MEELRAAIEALCSGRTEIWLRDTLAEQGIKVSQSTINRVRRGKAKRIDYEVGVAIMRLHESTAQPATSNAPLPQAQPAAPPTLELVPKPEPPEDDGERVIAKVGANQIRMKADASERFLAVWDAFDFKKGKREAAGAWLQIEKEERRADERMGCEKGTAIKALMPAVITAAQQECKWRAAILKSGRTPKWLQGWLSARRFEDEVYADQREGAWERSTMDPADRQRAEEDKLLRDAWGDLQQIPEQWRSKYRPEPRVPNEPVSTYVARCRSVVNEFIRDQQRGMLDA